MEQKTCPKCKQTKPLAEFPFPESTRGAYKPRCHTCYWTKSRVSRKASLQKLYREALFDCYVKKVLFGEKGSPAKDIAPYELIEAKRLQLMVQRGAK